MSTTMTPPAATGGSNFDQIGAALAGPEPSQAGSDATTGTTDEPVVDTPPVEADSTPAEETQPVEDAAAETTEQPETEVNPYEVDEGEDVTPQTLNTLLQTDRGRQIYQSFKAMREFAKPIDQGGIGHAPTVEQLRDYYSTYTDRVMMDHDLSSQNPQQADRLVNFLFDPKRGPGTNVVAQQIAPSLAKLSPETYAAAAQPFIQNYAGALYERYQQAKESGDDKLRGALWFAANIANYDMTGKWLNEAPPNGNGNGNGQPANGQADPLSARQAELDRRQAELDQQAQQVYQRQNAEWQSTVNRQIGSAVTSEIDKALAPLKASSTERNYKMYARDFHELVTKSANRDPQAYKLYMVKVDQARRDPNVNLAAEYVKLIQPVIKAERVKFLEEAGVAGKQLSDARHAELRQIDGKKGVPNGAGSAGPPATKPISRQPGEQSADFNLRQLRALMG